MGKQEVSGQTGSEWTYRNGTDTQETTRGADVDGV